MEAIVLAGGLGTRLRSVVSDIPKPMAPIHDKPFLTYILRYLKKHGIDRIILAVGYRWEVIKEYFGTEFDGIELIYSLEEEPLGTGGAIKQALDKTMGEEVLIINGDTFFNIDLTTLSLNKDSGMLICLKQMEKIDRYGCVEVNALGTVESFAEKEYRKNGNINGGIYLSRKNIFNNYELNEHFSFEEFIQKNFKGLNISAKVFTDYFIDIGIPEDFHRAQKEITKIL